MPDLRLAGAAPDGVSSAARQDTFEAESAARGAGIADDSMAGLLFV